MDGLDRKLLLFSTGALILNSLLFVPLGNYFDHHWLNREQNSFLASFESDKASPQMTNVQINWTATVKDPEKETP